jgi:hypothetical protein
MNPWPFIQINLHCSPADARGSNFTVALLPILQWQLGTPTEIVEWNSLSNVTNEDLSVTEITKILHPNSLRREDTEVV